MYILFKENYGRIRKATLLNGRKEWYNKLLAEGIVFEEKLVTKAIAQFSRTRPRPKQTIGQFCYDLIIEKTSTTTDAKQTTVKPKTEPTTTTAKKRGTTKKL